MYTLKSIARRSTALGMAVAMVAAAVMPAASALAQSALTPLTDRSLLLSSSAPGYIDTDGSGYRTGATVQGGNPNQGPGVPDSYAPAGSGPNGKKTGEKFTFKVSSNGTVKGFSFQYCTTAAGFCKAPGNNTGDFRGEFDGSVPDDWDMVSDRQANDDSAPGVGDGGWASKTSDLDITGTFAKAASAAVPTAGQFQISVNGTATAIDDWSMVARNAEDNAWINGGNATSDGLTGKNNYLVLHSATGIALTAGQEVTVEFKASETVHITNPGAGSFFVKINTYDTNTHSTLYTDTVPSPNPNVIDGGVTVANVMTDSIHIVTKVLETMAFSVGIQNPDTVDKVGTVSSPASNHGTCEPISQTSTLTGLSNNRLNLGDPNAEFSLDTNKAYDVHSYWRLSSNSSGGATVYYSGTTLSNTSGDQIAAMVGKAASNPGTEQFGLGFVDAGADTLANALTSGDPGYVDGGDLFQAGHRTPSSYPFVTLGAQTIGGVGTEFEFLTSAQLDGADYRDAAGTIDNGLGGAGTAQFKFVPTSITNPEVIAKQSESVISCATAKMRYVANIGADTPAGVYTTKVNYLAAPQY